MDNIRSLVNFAILNANQRNGKNYLDGLVPFVEELFIRKEYAEVNIDRICHDFATEFHFRIPIHPMIVVLRRLGREGKIKNCNNNIWKIQKIAENAILETRKEYEQGYKQVLDAFILFIKTDSNETIGEQEANDTLIAFLEKQDARLLLFAKKNLVLFPKVRFEGKLLKKMALFLEKESNNVSDVFKYVVEVAAGHLLASTIVNEEKELHEEKIQKINIYCDTAHILKLLGLDGDVPRRMVEDLFTTLIDSKCRLLLFKHTHDEILGNINNAKRWSNDPACDMKRASKTTLYFIENNYTYLEIDRVLNNVDVQLKKFNVEIEDSEYKTLENVGQSDERILEGYITKEYQKALEGFDENVNKYLIENDVRSITMIYRKVRACFPRRFKDLKNVFMCSNVSLAKACRMYHLEVEEPNRDSFIPICVTDTFLCTYMWLQSPQEIDKLAKRTIMAEVYSVLKPSDSMIRKYLTEVQNHYKQNEITEDDYLLLRASSVINELLPERATTADQVTKETPLEILENIKSQSKEEGLRKYYEEKEEHKKAREALDRERETKKAFVAKKEKDITNIFSLVFDCIAAFSIVIVTFMASLYANIIAAIILSLLALGSFWGFARGQSYYEQQKTSIILPLVKKVIIALWNNDAAQDN